MTQHYNSIQEYKEEITRRLLENISTINDMSLDQLYEFQTDLEDNSSIIEDIPLLDQILGNLPILFSCRKCRETYGNCPYDTEECEDREQCRNRWLANAGRLA